MRIVFAATAVLSIVVSTAFVASSATAAPLFGPSASGARASAGAPGYDEIVRDGITLLHQRKPVAATPVSGTGPTRSDFDGDGRDDIATLVDDGVILRYSSAPHRDHLRTEVPGGGCLCFGFHLAAGNFDGDRYDDLVITDPDEPDLLDLGHRAGAVWIFSGGPGGLQVGSVRHLTQGTAGMPGASSEFDMFGGALATGDITGDGRDDLAIGLPGKNVGAAREAGAAIVLRGGPTGIVTTGARWIDQNTTGVPGTAERGDRFGASLAIGTVNKGRHQDLVVGTPSENEGQLGGGSGMITQFWGGSTGISLTKVTSVSGEAVTRAAKTEGTYLYNLGMKVGITDTTGDGYGEVISGAPHATIGWDLQPGAVVSFAGRSTGLSATGVRVLSQDSPGVAGATEDQDRFGASVSLGDVTGDGLGDVLVGVPQEDIGKAVDAGSIVLLRGSAKGLTGTGSQSLDQNAASIPGAAERDDVFGQAVSVLNLNGSGALDAAVGASGEQITGDPAGFRSGSITTFPGGAKGLGTGTATFGRNVVPDTGLGGRFGINLVNNVSALSD